MSDMKTKCLHLAQQCAMWVFNACPQVGTPWLLFGMSLGNYKDGYAPTVGCRDGAIAVGRLTNSILLVDISTGLSDFEVVLPAPFTEEVFYDNQTC
jgi:hypothetical protein